MHRQLLEGVGRASLRRRTPGRIRDCRIRSRLEIGLGNDVVRHCREQSESRAPVKPIQAEADEYGGPRDLTGTRKAERLEGGPTKKRDKDKERIKAEDDKLHPPPARQGVGQTKTGLGWRGRAGDSSRHQQATEANKEKSERENGKRQRAAAGSHRSHHVCIWSVCERRLWSRLFQTYCPMYSTSRAGLGIIVTVLLTPASASRAEIAMICKGRCRFLLPCFARVSALRHPCT